MPFARCYIELPASIQNKKVTIHIKNDNDKCFVFCLGKVLDPNPEKINLERVSIHLKKVCANLGLDKLKISVSLKNIPRIEENFNLNINIFGHDGEINFHSVI